MKNVRNAAALVVLVLAAGSSYEKRAQAQGNSVGENAAAENAAAPNAAASHPAAASPADGNAAKDRGREIAQLVDQRNSGFATELSEAELTLIDAHGKQVSRQLQTRTIEVAGDGDRSIVTFVAPADIKGTKLLTWAHGAGSDDQWLFLPAIKRVKRISSNNKSGSFMGSEFSYEDLSSTEVDKFTYEFIDETRFEGAEVWRYVRYPTDEDSGYRRQVVWVAKQLLQPVKIEYYNRRDELTKIAHYAGFKKYGQYYRPTVVQMANMTTGKRSIIKWHSRSLGAALPDGAFRPEAL